MVGNGLLEFDSDDAGELFYTVCGAQRPAGGATQLSRCSSCQRATGAGSRCTRCGKLLDPQLRALKDEVDRAGTALTAFRQGSRLLDAGRPEGDKNLVVGGLLGLLGPMGWFYAAPMKEAAIGTVLFVLAYKLLPAILLYPAMGLLTPLFVLLGALYAWRYNRTGQRSSLFLDDGGSG
jgi:hypothetical protein